MTVSTFLRDQCLLSVDDAGGAGLPIIFQHGLCGDAGQTTEAFPADTAFRRVTIEMRGHGRSAAGDPSKFSIATFTDDVASFIAEKHLKPVVVGGISMGATIALRLAVKYPQLVKGLIIARPAWIIDNAPENMMPNAEVGALLARLPPDEARQQFMAGDTANLLKRDAQANLDSLIGFFARAPIDITAALLTAISADGPGVSEDAVRDLAIPTLVVGHEQDLVHPIAYAQALAGMIAGSNYVEITPKAADKLRYVSEFRAAIQDFLNAHFRQG
ncbi:alpha/beta fold hydrolase [Rhizobium tumorigenes]|uniref:Alpha/beta hydrolase n=1 Tax=Rhizobium tumorigenes TaxID=2041385 RepID=A0AAF1KT40_9HYPH|nr:alpha/beta hydrolase [Rhizobium tumorigenes]WFR98802.1 alpha/beta hydrolase [Rhizobium tumorigenes]